MKRSIATGLLILVTVTATFAQKVGPYKVTGIKIRPFDEVTGKFEDELAPDSNGGYWNDLSKSALALVEVSGEPGAYAPKRNVSIRVTEGRKLKLTRVGAPGILDTDGKYYVPVWLYGSMCDTIHITATITGQAKPSTMKRVIDFKCGE